MQEFFCGHLNEIVGIISGLLWCHQRGYTDRVMDNKQW